MTPEQPDEQPEAQPEEQPEAELNQPEVENPDLGDEEIEEGGDVEEEETKTEIKEREFEDRGVCKGTNRKDGEEDGEVIEECFCRAQAQNITVDGLTWGPKFSTPYVEETIAGNWCNDYDINKPTCCNHIYM